MLKGAIRKALCADIRELGMGVNLYDIERSGLDVFSEQEVIFDCDVFAARGEMGQARKGERTIVIFVYGRLTTNRKLSRKLETSENFFENVTQWEESTT